MMDTEWEITDNVDSINMRIWVNKVRFFPYDILMYNNRRGLNN